MNKIIILSICILLTGCSGFDLNVLREVLSND